MIAPLSYLLRLFLAGVFFCVFVWLSAVVVRPPVSHRLPAYAPEVVESARRCREVLIDPNYPTVLYRYVDYAQSDHRSWYAKRQSPILDSLVADGTLPPVADRVGPEPAVLEGVDDADDMNTFRLRGLSEEMRYAVSVDQDGEGADTEPPVYGGSELMEVGVEVILPRPKSAVIMIVRPAEG